MDQELLIALLSLFGSVIGTFAGIIVNTRLVNFRLSRLEEKVDKHNHVIDRVYRLEKFGALLHEELKAADRRMRTLEKTRK